MLLHVFVGLVTRGGLCLLWVVWRFWLNAFALGGGLELVGRLVWGTALVFWLAVCFGLLAIVLLVVNLGVGWFNLILIDLNCVCVL